MGWEITNHVEDSMRRDDEIEWPEDEDEHPLGSRENPIVID